MARDGLVMEGERERERERESEREREIERLDKLFYPRPTMFSVTLDLKVREAGGGGNSRRIGLR